MHKNASEYLYKKTNTKNDAGSFSEPQKSGKARKFGKIPCARLPKMTCITCESLTVQWKCDINRNRTGNMYKFLNFTFEKELKMAQIIKWTNKFSGEQGYVKTVRKADGFFTNTFDAAEAKVFSRQCDVAKAMNLLASFGECENNDFEAVEA